MFAPAEQALVDALPVGGVVALAELAARAGRTRAFLTQTDRDAWDALLDHNSSTWLGHRDDLALPTARTVHIGRKHG